jgi:hypothetical protein
MKRPLPIVAFLLFSMSSTAYACSCTTGNPAYEFNAAKMVFIGRMLRGTETLSVKNEAGKSRTIQAGQVRFKVEEVFKGNSREEVIVEVASMDGTSCGPYGLTRGERYLVYAYSSGENKDVLDTGVCTRTTLVSSKYAKGDLEFLRNLPPEGVGGNLNGGISADLRAGGATPLANVRVRIIGSEQEIVTYTDKNGRYEVKQLKPGKYRVEPEFPPNYTSEHKFGEVNVDDRGTAGVWFEAYIDGKVSGRVIDHEGNGVEYASLDLVDKTRTVYGYSSGEDGEFEVEGVPPGGYFLFINLSANDSQDDKPFYYPGTFEREKATVVRVGLGEKIEGLEFRLPDEFRVRTVEGQVVWKDGTPAANVEVMLLCPTSNKAAGLRVEYRPPTTKTDEQGRFLLKGFSGETYWIEARASRPGAKEGEVIALHSPSRKLSLDDSLKNLRVVLSIGGFFGEGCSK